MEEQYQVQSPEELTLALSIAEAATSRIREMLGSGFETRWKQDNTPVTDIDIEVNKLAIGLIKQQYPEDRIYGEEESAEGDSGFTWIIDPIDGTQALDMRLPAFTFCIARTDRNGQPEFGIVSNPSTGELFVGERAKPTLRNGEPIHVSVKDALETSYIYLGSRMLEGHTANGDMYSELESQGAKVVNLRALAFHCLQVASGQAEGAFIGVKTPFEAAALKLIIEGAGGRVTDLAGNTDFRYDGDINGLIVSNSLVHNALVELAQKKAA